VGIKTLRCGQALTIMKFVNYLFIHEFHKKTVFTNLTSNGGLMVILCCVCGFGGAGIVDLSAVVVTATVLKNTQ
jgi:hypothetical protein